MHLNVSLHRNKTKTIPFTYATFVTLGLGVGCVWAANVLARPHARAGLSEYTPILQLHSYSLHPFYNYTPTVYTHSTITLLQFTPILQLHSYSLHPFYNYTPTVYTHSTITLPQFTPIIQLHSHSLHPLYNYTPTV